MKPSVLLRLAATAGVLVAAAGCVSIPESSSVNAGHAVSSQDERPLSSNNPNGPRPGAGRKEIATGYLNAMLAFPPSPDVVRQFLTPDAAAGWNPAEGFVVYTESDKPRLSETANSVVFSARALGSLDSRGSWTTTQGRARDVTSKFSMARHNGEWRLRNPLSGMYVDQDYFQNYYSPFSLYFFDASKTILTADPVHMLLGDGLATSLVTDLLKGPTPDISGATSSSLPPTVTVDVGVSISASGVAEVPLGDGILQLSAEDRRLLAVQLVWTLRQLPAINTIVVTVNGARIDLGVGTDISVNDFSGFDPAGFAASRQLYALTGQGLVAVSQTGTTTVPGPILASSRDARSAAVDPNAGQGAVVNADGTRVTVAGLTAADTTTSDWYTGGVHVIEPSWDIFGLLWIADNRADGAHLYVATDGHAQEISAPGITGKTVHSIAVSRDGVRLAAVVGDHGNRRLVIAVIERDATNPHLVTLRQAERVITPLTSPSPVSAASWISPTSLAVLVDGTGGQPEPTEIAVDGALGLGTSFPSFLPIKPIALACGPNSDTSTAIVDRRGQLYEQTLDAGWAQIGGSAKIRAPFYPG